MSLHCFRSDLPAHSDGDRKAIGLGRPVVLPSVLLMAQSWVLPLKSLQTFHILFISEVCHQMVVVRSRASAFTSVLLFKIRILFSDCGFVILSQFVNCDARMLAALPSPMGLNRGVKRTDESLVTDVWSDHVL